jgi:multiple antibiotic resistance protein
MLQHTFQDVIQDTVTLFVIIDPIALVPIFIGVTQNQNVQGRQTIALRAVAISAVVLGGFLVFGQFLLQALEVSLSAFKIGGGLVLLIVGLQMILENGSENGNDVEVAQGDVAVFPLAIPFIAGPGAIMAIVLLTDNNKFNVFDQAITAGVMLSILAFTYLILRQSERIQQVLGTTGANMITRIVGLLVVAIAIQTMLEGIQSFFNLS